MFEVITHMIKNLCTEKRGRLEVMWGKNGVSGCALVLGWMLMCLVSTIVLAKSSPGAQKNSWKVVDFALSPNGSKLAELVRVKGARESSMEVVIENLLGPAVATRKAFSGARLSSVEWLNEGSIAFISSGKKSEILKEVIASDHVTRIFESKKKISSLLPEPRGHLLAYSYVSSSASGKFGKAVSVKVTNNLMVLNLVLPKKEPAPYLMTFHAGIIRWKGDAGKLLVRRQWRWTQWRPVMSWVDGRLVVLLHGRTGYKSFFVDVKTGRIVNYHFRCKCNWTYMVAARNHTIAMLSTGSHNLVVGGNRLHVYVRGRSGRVRAVSLGSPEMILRVWPVGSDGLIAQALGTTVDYDQSIGGVASSVLIWVNWRKDTIRRTYAWPKGSLGAWPRTCSVDRKGNQAVCVAQTLRDPPMLVSVELRTGAMRKLGYMRSGERRLDFRFRKLLVRNAFGEDSVGFLALPAGWRKHGVPLAVMTYGFARQYSRYGQWITSYPVARLVHAGIAVLLLNFPKERPWKKGEFSATLREEVEAPLSTVAKSVPAVRQAGVNVTRAMIMGWSQGGLVAAFAIQDLHEFVAAQVGDPEEWTITSFALGNAMVRRFLERQFGGPPDRRYIERYLDFDPISDGRPAHGPILFEFVRRNVAEGQFLEEWRAVGTHVEAFAYRNSNHALNVPAEAKISRERNLDWAKLNLLGPQSVSRAELRRVGLTIPVNGWWSRGRRGAGQQRPGAPNLEARVRRSGRRTTGIEQSSRAACRGAARIAEHFGPGGLADPADHGEAIRSGAAGFGGAG